MPIHDKSSVISGNKQRSQQSTSPQRERLSSPAGTFHSAVYFGSEK